MTSLVQAMKNVSYTENGALTHATSTDALVDWFFASGSSRGKDEHEIYETWYRAFTSNPQAAMRLLMYCRDVRGGQGERHTPRIIMRRLAEAGCDAFRDNLHHVTEYGRWDDLLVCVGTPLEQEALALISNALCNNNALCSKWMPNEASTKKIFGTKLGNIAKKIAKYMSISPGAYRKMRTRLNKVVETQMCAKEWDQIVFSKVPSQAMLKSRNAFTKNCGTRFEEFIEAVNSGEETIHSGTLYPHQLSKIALAGESHEQTTEREQIKAQWDSLPNFLEGNKLKMLPIVDTSWSMGDGAAQGVDPIDVAVGLGAYIAERNIGPFHNTFINFDDKPKLQIMTGEDIWEKLHNLKDAEWGGSTDLIETFNVLLHHADISNIPQSEMPDMLLIISDMEFNHTDQGFDLTTYEEIKRKYRIKGYTAPHIVFWNLNSRKTNAPVLKHQTGASLVSGFSPSILEQLMSTGTLSTPIELVLEVVNNERYARITI